MSTSSLLYAALTNRLGVSTQNGTQQSQPESEQQLSEWESISHTSDDELVDVSSLPGTAPGTPRTASRPPSPPLSRQDGSPLKASARARNGTGSKAKSKTDPLRSLPSEVSQRIFLQLSLPSLVACSSVCRRWRRSQTLNYCFFRYSQAFDPMEHTDSFLLITPPALQDASSGALASNGAVASHSSSSAATSTSTGGLKAATWTRREARTDWKLTLAKQVRMARRELERGDALGIGGGGGGASTGSGYATPSRTERLASQGVLTNTERRQQQWAEESAAQSGAYSKHELREHYKSQGSRGGKVKGKTGKGGAKTGHDSLWD